MTTISAKVIADSISPEGNRITTIRARYPRWIHAEGRTHRQLTMTEHEFAEDYPCVVLTDSEPRTPSPMEDRNLSRNAASSRAIPVKKMIEAVREDPAVPLFWGANQRGMQAGAECTAYVHVPRDGGLFADSREKAWLYGMEQMIALADAYEKAGYHKQIVNRLLEPFMHIEVLFTATEWTNFYALRIHNAAEPHIRLLAERMKAAQDASTPTLLQPGEWHLPYVTDIERNAWKTMPFTSEKTLKTLLMLSVARCAHLSYETVGTGEPIDPEQAARIYTQLVGGDVIHASPAEHQATPDVVKSRTGPLRTPVWLNPEEHGNLVGFRQLRKQLPGECQ